MAKAPSKAQAIRDFLSANKKPTAEQVVEALGQKGIKITVQRVYDVKAKAKPKQKRAMAVSGKAGDESTEGGQTGKRKTRPYPQRTLEDALSVPKAIREKNRLYRVLSG
jgi:hypothetical protein